MSLLNQYKGLKRENYILFIGRMVTSLGAMIWPVLTLILTVKMGMSATSAGLVNVISGLVMIPVSILGGKLADQYSKRNIIIACDSLSVVLFVTCSVIPLSMITIVLFMFAAACQTMENPAYEALVADITPTSKRESAYSLLYLGGNLGMIVAATMGGILLNNYLWLSYLISGISIGISTILIYLFIKDVTPVVEEEHDVYQGSVSGGLIDVLKSNWLIVIYIIGMGLFWSAYSQYGFLMPIDIARVQGEAGPVIFGSVNSINCIVVVLFTPLFTSVLAKWEDTKKSLLGMLFAFAGYFIFLMFVQRISAYYIAVILFTFGEILVTITASPFTTRRIPASHRGRINGFMTVMQSVMNSVVIYSCGKLYDFGGSTVAWSFVLGVILMAMVCGFIVVILDKKYYPDLYYQK